MRHYIIPSWTNAAEGHDSWSGHSPDDRKMRSHCLSNGKANLDAYSDEAIGVASKKRKPISIYDRICPQQKRLTVLENQLKELEKERFKVDEETFHEYRCVLLKKIARQKILLDKAMNWQESSIKHQSKPVVCREKQAEKTFKEERGAKVQGSKNSLKKDLILYTTGVIILFIVGKMIF